ncbi:MAG: cysteine--tRNA ligase [Candidatus Gracilibacteria bacterium]|nr:cysteine--tRNA ligase [Candidatus Gracilibacteria bacterium]
MPAIHLYNTLTRKKEEFMPIEPGKVKMYNCGPTVYSYAHIGNCSSYLFADLLRRWLEYRGYEVTQIKNITDVGHLVSDGDEGEDKMAKAAKAEKKDPFEIARFYEQAYIEDEHKLRIKDPAVRPRATEHLKEMAEHVQDLLSKGYAYEISDGIYFDVQKFSEYGKLSGNTLDDLKAGARIDVNEEKKHPADFALWKKAEANHLMQWDYFGFKGYPGWHIECSAMSTKYLGDTFDIHTGGVDNIFPHHECEIAQSEARTGKKWVNYWMHKGYLQVEGEKMSKSKGNFYTLRDLEAKGYNPLAFRYLALSSHYRSQLDFSFAKMDASQKVIDRLNDFWKRVKGLGLPAVASAKEGTRVERTAYSGIIAKYREKFEAAMDDDLNTPVALASVFDLMKEVNKLLDEQKLSEKDSEDVMKFMHDFNTVFDVLTFGEEVDSDLQQKVEVILQERETARQAKDWSKSDELRDQLKEMGVEIKDGSEGTTWKKL